MSWPSPAQFQAIADAGGWVVAIVVLALVCGAFIIGKIVPGYIYKGSEDRADKATDALSRNNDVLERLSGNVETLTKLRGR